MACQLPRMPGTRLVLGSRGARTRGPGMDERRRRSGCHYLIASQRWPSLLRPSEARSGSLQQAEIGGWRTLILLYKALICMVLYVMVQVGWRCGLDFSP